jgi:hypothetical protein
MSIKGVLKEELENSERMKIRYEEALARLPKGSLIRKTINGHRYYYLQVRENGKVSFAYKGKTVDEAVVKQYQEAKVMRAKYRTLLSQTKKQIKFLKGVLRGQEAI